MSFSEMSSALTNTAINSCYSHIANLPYSHVSLQGCPLCIVQYRASCRQNRGTGGGERCHPTIITILFPSRSLLGPRPTSIAVIFRNRDSLYLVSCHFSHREAFGFVPHSFHTFVIMCDARKVGQGYVPTLPSLSPPQRGSGDWMAHQKQRSLGLASRIHTPCPCLTGTVLQLV